MRGLDPPARLEPLRRREGPGIHVLVVTKNVDGRDKPGHDGKLSEEGPHLCGPVVSPAIAAEAERHAGATAAVISVGSAAVIALVAWVISIAAMVRPIIAMMMRPPAMMAMTVMAVPVLRADVGRWTAVCVLYCL
jgi:hypothetical protein